MAPMDRPHLSLKGEQKGTLTQGLFISPNMQQALHVLQLPLLEIEGFIEEQAMNNPLLEVEEENKLKEEPPEDSIEDPMIEKDLILDEKDFTLLKHLEEEFRDTDNESTPINRSKDDEKYKTYKESSVCAEISLQDSLIQQARETFTQECDQEIAKTLIGYIDEAGFLGTPLQEIAQFHQYKETDLKRVLQVIQTFEPYGVGAFDVKESLLIQLKCLHKEKTLAYSMIESHYEDLLHNRLSVVEKKTGWPPHDIQKAVYEDIAKLDLHPGSKFASPHIQTIVPDVTLREDGEQLVVEVNREYIPHLRLNRRYLKMLDDKNIPIKTKHFIRHHIFSAKWLMRNLQQRHSTIERIANSLVVRQKDFLTQPEGKLIPLTMKALAEELELNESTIARTVSNKYIETPRGLLPLRSFFTHGYATEQGTDLSSKTIRDAIEEIIKGEDKAHPLSDEKISGMLKEQEMPCARRTVAKYRSLLNLGNVQQRRRYKERA